MSYSFAQAPTSVEELVGKVADEFTQRLNRGEQPSVEEYVEKHPEIAALLREVLPALGLLRRPDVEAALSEGEPSLGAPLGDFRLLREIGRGGMGIVYEAQQLSLNRRVAVKVLPFAAALDPRQLQRFKNEALAAASLHHEHIVPVHFVGCERGVHFYAMQYINGLSVAAIIGQLRQLAGRSSADQQLTVPYSYAAGTSPAAVTDTLPLAELTTKGTTRSPEYFHRVARLGLQAARGLDHAHRASVLHRDIKPGNLLVDGRGNLWITDFGLAQMSTDASLTLTGELVGTFRYMSPEQTLAGRVPVDELTDIYSLGATLYELLTLEPVFRGKDRQELLRQIPFDDPRPPRQLNRQIPRDLETIVLTALAKAPGHRYRSAKEMAEDLDRFLNDQPIKARPERLTRWLWRRARRHATSLALALAALVTGVVLLLFIVHLNKPSPEEEENQRQQQGLTALTRDLDHDKKVILIGERGRPRYFRLKTDPKVAKIGDAPDGEFSVQNWDHGLVELVPDPRRESFRFSAEVRHERQTNQESTVGIYFAHSEHRDGDSVEHFHCTVAFNDLVDVGLSNANRAPRGNSVGLVAHRQPPVGLVHYTFLFPDTCHFFAPAKPIGALGPWRKIAVEVRPKTIKLFWEGNCIANITRNTLKTGARWMTTLPGMPPLTTPPPFAARDGLGLFVSQGAASFHNVVVEKLDDEP